MKNLPAAVLSLCAALCFLTACSGKTEAPASTPKPYPKQMGQVKAADTYPEQSPFISR